EDVVVGCANQAGEDSRCVGRHAGLLAGLPIEVAGSVLQRNCGSGLNAIVMAAQAVTCGEGETFVAGGVESMSRAPFVMNKAETPFSRDGRIYDSTIGARFPNPQIERQFGADTMPETADNLARDYQITREACDVFAEASQRKYAAGKAAGFFEGEILPVEVPGGRAGPVKVAEDEHPRPQTDLAALAKLRPLQEGGVTTAGNASGINDGAVAMIVASRRAAVTAHRRPLCAGDDVRRRRPRHRRGARTRLRSRRIERISIRPGAASVLYSGGGRPRESSLGRPLLGPAQADNDEDNSPSP